MRLRPWQVSQIGTEIGKRSPSLSTLRGTGTLARMSSKPRWRRGPLAVPPRGSGLQAVPGDAGAPGIGNTLGLLVDAHDLVLEYAGFHGPVFWTHALGTKIVFVTGGEATQVVLANKDKAFSQSGWEYFIGPFFNRGLMLLDFAEHLHHRRIMQQAFTRDRLTGYLAVMDELITVRVEMLSDREPEVEIYPEIKQLSMKIASELFMATQTNERLESAFNDTVHAGAAVVRFPVPGLSWSRGLEGRRTLERHFRTSLPARRASDGNDLFAALCHARTEEGETFSDDDIVNHMIFLMMAAHDTSSITATATVYYLAKHPEWQERVRAECLALANKPLDVGALAALDTLDMVINEALRLTAAVPELVRKTVKDTDVLGHYIPAGTIVGVMPGVNHLLAQHWTDPENFDPDRFSDARREDKSHRYAFMPFGGGAHKCIGLHFGTLEVKSIIVRLLNRYRLELPADYEIRWNKSTLWFPTDGLPIALHPLNDPRPDRAAAQRGRTR